jgi:hypothetical protein
VRGDNASDSGRGNLRGGDRSFGLCEPSTPAAGKQGNENSPGEDNVMTKAPSLPVAEKVVKGMPPGEISDKMESYENLYYAWRGVGVGEYGDVEGSRWFTWIRNLQLWIARKPIRIFRAEISELGLFATKALVDAKAAESQAQTYKEYVRMVEANRELRAFLEEHFKNDLMEAQARNVSIPILLKEILLRLKKA